MKTLSHRQFVLWGTLIYAIIVCVLSSFHEVWRDEVGVISIVAQSRSLADLFAVIPNFGHPGLWYVLVYFGYLLCRQFVVLKIMNLLVMIAGIFIFLRYAPFSRLQKVLFCSGLFPLYVYPIINRDYGLGMMLVFAFCALYPKRLTHPISVGIVLFLLANTHIHCWILSAAFLAFLIFEFVFDPQTHRQWASKAGEAGFAAALAVVGLTGSLISITPDYTWGIVRPHASMALAAKSVVWAFWAPERAFPTVFGLSVPLLLKLTAWTIAIYLLRKKRLLFLYAVGILGLEIFFHVMFVTTALRHQAAFYLLLIVVLWLDRLIPDDQGRPRWEFLKTMQSAAARAIPIGFTLILIGQAAAAYPAVRDDIAKDYSPAKRLAQFLKNDPALRQAVVIPEPDTFAEALPYYADNPIYIAREGRFGKFTHFTTETRLHYSLKELLEESQRVQNTTGRPVVILMGHRLAEEGPFDIPFSYLTRKIFHYTPESLEKFDRATRKIASFRETLTDEEYDVYLLL